MCVALDVRVYARIIATCCDCAVAASQPKPVVVRVTMTGKVDQCICMKFCQNLGHSCSETYNMIQKTFGNQAMGRTQVKEWFRWFKEG